VPKIERYFDTDMNKMKLFVCAALLVFGVAAMAQNNANSPATRYGYGALADKSFAAQRGMGGIGYGLRNRFMINPMNPASYSGVDSLTFMFEAGLTGQYAWFEENGAKATKMNGNLEYLAMQFSLMRNLGLGIGLEPVSFVGYEYGDTARWQQGEELYSETWQGSGGLNKVYASIGYNFFNRLSAGVKAAYLYGDIFHYHILNNSSVSGAYNGYFSDSLRASGFTADFGLQYFQPVGKDKSLIIGLVYSPKTTFNGNIRYSQYSVNSAGAITNVDSAIVTNDSLFQMPASVGIGFTFNKFNKYTIGADVFYQGWSNVEAQFRDNESRLKNRLKINLGGEYIPNIMNNKFYNRMRYRAGASYSNSYFLINNSITEKAGVKDAGYNEYGAYFGIGFPMVDRRSFLNIAFEYSRVLPDFKQLIKEQYFKLTVSYTFNEEWFFKQKLR
jgi:hypothetical protein